MKSKQSASYYWGILHGINDWIAGFLLAHYTLFSTGENNFLALITYTVLAFGGQLPLGIWLDKNKNLRFLGIISISLMLLACLVLFLDPFSAIVLAGFSSAGIHVTGGCICLINSKEKITPLGIFTAPGVAGLTLGGFCGMLSINWILLPLCLIIILFLLILRNSFPVYQISGNEKKASLDRHDLMMLLLLLVLCLRSLLFDLANIFSDQFENGLLILGLSAFVGKLAGAFFADKIGLKTWAFISLPVAFVFLQFGQDNIIAMAVGVASLQSSVPITLKLVYCSMPSKPATASALSLGTGVAIAGLPLYISYDFQEICMHSSMIFLGIGAITLMALYLSFRIVKNTVKNIQ